jgi:type IV secretion system protein VirD4
MPQHGPPYIFLFLIGLKMNNDLISSYTPPPPRSSSRLKPAINPISTTFGSASFLSKSEAEHSRLGEPGEGRTAAPYLGSLADSRYDASPLYLYARCPSSAESELPESNGHLITIAPTRAGKGTSHIAPNLLTWPGPVLVVDIKGENYYLTAGCRAKSMNHEVYRFAPFEEESEIWNPIMSIRANLNWSNSTAEERYQEEEDARYLANLLITESGSPQHGYWERNGLKFLVGLLLHVRTAELPPHAEDAEKPEYEHRVHERSMYEMRRLLNLDLDNFNSLLEDMSESKRRLIREPAKKLKPYLIGEGKMGHAILSVIDEQTEVWSYERVHRATYKASASSDEREPAPNDFNFSQMRNGRTSIYLIIPPEYLTQYRAVLRVMIGFAMRELKTSYTQSKKHPQYQNQPPVLFILDEFPQLAYMRPIEDALSYLAGYGVRLWFFVQDISQLKTHYQKTWRSFLANTDTKCIFGVSDIETAEEVSKMVGPTTVEHYSYSQGSSEGHSYGIHSSVTTAHASFPKITPSEVMRMHKDKQIIFMKGLEHPIFCDLVKYYQFSQLIEYSKISPPKDINFN